MSKRHFYQMTDAEVADIESRTPEGCRWFPPNDHVKSGPRSGTMYVSFGCVSEEACAFVREIKMSWEPYASSYYRDQECFCGKHDLLGTLVGGSWWKRLFASDRELRIMDKIRGTNCGGVMAPAVTHHIFNNMYECQDCGKDVFKSAIEEFGTTCLAHWSEWSCLVKKQGIGIRQ